MNRFGFTKAIPGISLAITDAHPKDIIERTIPKGATIIDVSHLTIEQANKVCSLLNGN